MNKKSLIISIACTVVVTICLAIYTIVSVVGIKPKDPVNTTIAVAYRTEDKIEGLSIYDRSAISITYGDSENPAISYNEETGKYTAVKAGTAKAVVKLDEKGNTKTFEITVYEQQYIKDSEGNNLKDGDGNYIPASPVAVTNKAHLLQFAKLVNSTAGSVAGYRGYTIDLYDDIDLAGENWMPIGTLNKYFYGTFNGNGHVIKNMTIHVTTNNVESYLENDGTEKYMFVGFFGSIGRATKSGTGEYIVGTVNDLGFDGAYIKIDSDVKAEIEASLVSGQTFEQSGIGILSGRTRNAVIKGAENGTKITNSKIDGYVFCASKDIVTAMGGLVGVAADATQIQNYNVSLTIANDYDAAYYDTVGNVVGGLVGVVNNGTTDNAIIKNCEVNVKAVIKNDKNIRFGGAVGRLQNGNVENVTVKVDVRKSSNIETNDESLRDRVGGAVYYVDEKSTLKNVKTSIEADVFGYVSGFANINKGVITDCGVERAYINAHTPSGFVYINEGTIVYTVDYKGAAVDNATLRGRVNSGFAYSNAGTITGYDNVVTNAITGTLTHEYTKVNVVIRSRTSVYGTVGTEYEFSNSLGSAGFANISYSEVKDTSISNFDVTANISNDVNQVGLVFNLGFYGNTHKSTLSNMKVNTTLASTQKEVVTVASTKKMVSTTKYMAGAVARMYANSAIDGVDVIVNANKDANAEILCGAEFFGGIVARILENNVVVNNCNVAGYVYFNTSNYFASISTSEVATYNISLIGGLVGAINDDGLAATDGKITEHAKDAFKAIATTNAVAITNNTINDLTLYVNVGNNDVIESGKSANRWRFRALGATVGSINNDDGAIDLSSNKLEKVKIITVARDYIYSNNTSDNNSSLSDSTKSYGISNIVSGSGHDADVTKVEYEEVK